MTILKQRHQSETDDIVSSCKKIAITADRDTGDRDLPVRRQVVGALILGQIPEPNAAGTVAADDLALVRMDNHIVYRGTVAVTALDVAGADIPDLDGAVFGARHHPFAFNLEGDTSDVSGMALKYHQWCRIGGSDIE